MHIVVCVKMVPDTTQVSIDPVTNTLIREGVPFITNPFDTNAIEEALRFKDKYGGYVTALSMGPPAAESVLRKAISVGVDEGILLSDRAFGGADTLATSTVLGLAVKKIIESRPVDIVLCGKQTIDGDTAQVGPGIARRLNIPQLTLTDEIISVNRTQKTIKVRRKLEGYHEVVESKMPVLITVEREINKPRYPSLSNMLRANRVEIKTIDSELIGKADPKQVTLRMTIPEKRRRGYVLSGSVKEKAAELVRILSKKAFIN